MKILELRFKNLNSLYGEWCIDFTHPDYEANGLFAITGATGSGKKEIELTNVARTEQKPNFLIKPIGCRT